MPASPRAARLAAPSWLDARLLLGVVLVLASVVAGARLLASADDAQPVWVATRDLAAGTSLSEGDLEPGRVRLFGDGTRYVLAVGTAPLGYVLTRPVGARELLPAAGLVSPQAAAPDLRDVAVPVEAGHLPDDLQGASRWTCTQPSSSARATAESEPACRPWSSRCRRPTCPGW